MATITIAVRTDGYPAFTLEQELDGQIYRMAFKWNEREGAWYMDLADDAGDAILEGAKLVINWPITRRLTDARRPPGEIMAIDTLSPATDPVQADLGNRVQVVYEEAA